MVSPDAAWFSVVNLFVCIYKCQQPGVIRDDIIIVIIVVVAIINTDFLYSAPVHKLNVL